MNRLFLFFARNRVFFTFIILEFISVWLVLNKNAYQQAAFYKVSVSWSSEIDEFRNSIVSTLQLKEKNEELLEENARLKEALRNLKPSQGSRSDLPPEILNRYYFIPATVVNQSTERMNNFLTLNKGRKDGVVEGMGVISKKGIVGKVVSSSSNFALAQSILNPGFLVASEIKRTGIQGTTNWDGTNIYQAKVLYVPRNLDVKIGDTVIASGFNAVFPDGAPIGIVETVTQNEGESFFDIGIVMFHDFKKTDMVYVVGDRLKSEKDTLELITRDL